MLSLRAGIGAGSRRDIRDMSTKVDKLPMTEGMYVIYAWLNGGELLQDMGVTVMAKWMNLQEWGYAVISQSGSNQWVTLTDRGMRFGDDYATEIAKAGI